MYYNLTKNEYKEYAKKFNKLYIGKNLYSGFISYFIAGALAFSIIGFNLGYHSIKSFDLFDLGLLIFGCYSAMETVLCIYFIEKKQAIACLNWCIKPV